MITYDLMLDRQSLIGADKFSVAANANETLSLRFHFDRHWRRFDSKAAVFRNSDGEYYIIEVKDDRAQIPWEVLKNKGEFQLSVIGYEGEKVLSSDTVDIEVEESLLPEDYQTYSPSEVLFDRFKRECIAQAYLDYEDEIKQLKESHLAELVQIAQDVSKSNKQYEARLDEKDEEIRQIELAHTAETNAFRTQIADMDEQINYYKEKADKWDLIDYAVSLKTSTSQALWLGVNGQVFDLPMLNTCSISTFNSANFGNGLRTVGLDLTSVTSFANMFATHKTIEILELRNTQNITSFVGLVDCCRAIRQLSIDNMKSCGSLTKFAFEATNLLSVSFGSEELRVGTYERAFQNCRLLKEINGRFNMDYATNVSYMFSGCHSLEKVELVENTLRMSLSFGDCINLSRDSMISIFESLSPDVSATLSVSEYAFETNFTQEERSEWLDYVTDTKNWVLALQ